MVDSQRNCTFPECTGRWKGRGLCSSHLEQSRRGGVLKPIKRRRSQHYSHRNSSGNKQCSMCLRYLPEKSFYSQSSRVDGLTLDCRDCNSGRTRARRYGVTYDYLLERLQKQDNICACCHQPLTNWEVDHDHSCCPGRESCGECIRGILCRTCNSTLGAARDNPDTLLSAVRYLEETK